MKLMLFVIACSVMVPLQAETFLLPENGDSVVGSISLTTSRHEDTISELARVYDQGFVEMRRANPEVDAWLPGEGTEVIIPSQYVLPDTPQEGIVINVPEMRLYYYPKPAKGEPASVTTFPISIGRQDWKTPHGETRIIAKKKDPVWRPPESIRKEHAENGDPLPKVVPAGPDNPLGLFAMRLGIPGYLIHGTNKPYGLGMRVTHGCVRLYPKDIEKLFAQVAVGTKVKIINQPFKSGWRNGTLYMEAHPPLEEDLAKDNEGEYLHIVRTLNSATEGIKFKADWEAIREISKTQSGMPMAIGLRDKIETASFQHQENVEENMISDYMEVEGEIGSEQMIKHLPEEFPELF